MGLSGCSDENACPLHENFKEIKNKILKLTSGNLFFQKCCNVEARRCESELGKIVHVTWNNILIFNNFNKEQNGQINLELKGIKFNLLLRQKTFLIFYL